LVNGENTDIIKVNGRTLIDVVSSLALDRVDVIKIDIEGAELEVLRSATRLLKEMRPVIICEYGINTWPAFGATAEGLLELLEHCDYFAGIFDTKRRVIRSADDQVWRSLYTNLILQPNESKQAPV
jgi:hypothetical protein